MGAVLMNPNILDEIASAEDIDELQRLKVALLGKSGFLRNELAKLGGLPIEERKVKGLELNRDKSRIEDALKIRHEELASQELSRTVENERIDVSLPGTRASSGGLHILTHTINRLVEVFRNQGYELVTGPELETDELNFTSLNFPPDHPARDAQDTFWATDGRLLRTHTSPMQVRYMLSHRPPFKVVAPGKVFRNEATDITHEAQFHQLEALVVDKRITMGDMRGAIASMAKELFGDGIKTRLQPSYFPFVEPGAEFAIWWENPRTGRREWLELGGCGMVHPNVLKSVGYTDVTGFAFGFGVERLAIITNGIPDIRYFHHNDMRFLRQFTGGAV
jgi:phenylalanyl-tRNA synthetase alpha chain